MHSLALDGANSCTCNSNLIVGERCIYVAVTKEARVELLRVQDEEAMSFVEILIADDHELFRRTVRLFIESQPGYRVCGEASDGMEPLKRCANYVLTSY
jgi:hypothetical protein